MRYLIFCLAFFCRQALSAQNTDIGVQLYSFREQFKKDVPGTMQKVAQMGVRYVETAGFYDMDIKAFKQLLDANGLRAVSTGADWETLQDAAKLQTVIANAKILGASYVVCFWIPHNGSEFTLADVQKAVKVFNKAGKTLSKSGLRLLYHPHGYEFRPYRDGELLMDYLVKKTNPRYVNYEMDIYWVKSPGYDPAVWLRKYPTRWKALHLKDQKKGTPGSNNAQTDVEWNVTLGEGNQDMPAVMREARKLGIQYYFIEDESSRSMEQTPKSLNYLKHLKTD